MLSYSTFQIKIFNALLSLFTINVQNVCRPCQYTPWNICEFSVTLTEVQWDCFLRGLQYHIVFTLFSGSLGIFFHPTNENLVG
jgi:hypothetical protein